MVSHLDAEVVGRDVKDAVIISPAIATMLPLPSSINGGRSIVKRALVVVLLLKLVCLGLSFTASVYPHPEAITNDGRR